MIKLQMGMVMSFMGKGLPKTDVYSYLMGALYKQFITEEIRDFNDFHKAILEIFTTFNSALPGKHYDVPSRKKVEKFFWQWKGKIPENEDDSERKKLFHDFMMENMNLSKPDAITLITGVLTPPAAMAAKRAGENLPQLKMIKVVPDVIFVPSLTVMALVAAKLSRRIILGNTAS
ncbi:hypothetical protein CFOL_v3_02300 [Cephalotus follicularis]|uniref:Uncharacterized protein n=1 Tax=Cephalotus follicularis TaxID=3775 RepID=A0A1Q3ASP7_CEPFO|nr:hypothetical protein CFOL_v3_02300 [Cephalotus follicularis]